MVSPLDRAPDLVVDPLLVYVRPFARNLIEIMYGKFEIAIWSAGSKKYVEEISKFLLADDIKPLFVWDREECSVEGSFFSFHEVLTKDLEKVKSFGYDLTNTIIIEDDPIKIRKFRDNAIIVKQYFGDNQDDELEKLARYVNVIDIASDIKRLDKNLWNFNR